MNFIRGGEQPDRRSGDERGRVAASHRSGTLSCKPALTDKKFRVKRRERVRIPQSDQT
jgi:hypothetical protein